MLLKSSNLSITLSQTGSVLTTTLFPHWFWVVACIAELRANNSQHNQIIPNSVLKNSPPGPQGLRLLTRSLTFTLTYILNYPLLSWIFFPQNLLSTTAVLPIFYHSRSFVFNCFKPFLLLSRDMLLSITMTKEKDMFTNLF